MGSALNTEIVISRSKNIHGGTYDYSKTIYKNYKTKMIIICPKHGEFFMTADNHLHGEGCWKCGRLKSGNLRKSNTLDFINKSKIIHDDKYEYSKVEYRSAFKKVRIICPIHGEFLQIPNSHLRGNGCRLCGYENNADLNRMSLEEFIYKSKMIHKNDYDYNKVRYVNANTPVCIICGLHGEFYQSPSNHLNGQLCPKCGIIQAGISRSNNHSYKVRSYKSYNYISIPLEDIGNYLLDIGYVKNKYTKIILEHIYVMAKHLGHPINTKLYDVHHKDGDGHNNLISNLELREKGHGRGHTIEEKLESNIYFILKNKDKLNNISNIIKNKLKEVL